MSMIPEVKCRRCGETFSSMRSRCPNCGTRRVTQSGRSPSTTPGTVRGTVSYERAETNTKWQMIFGLILVVAVILAVIVMVTTSLKGSDSGKTQTAVTPPVIQETPVVEAPPTPVPTPTPTVESIRIMYYTTPIETEFTMHEGDAPIVLTAQVLPLTIQGVKVTWTSSNEEILKVTATDDLTCSVEILGTNNGGVKLTAECLGVTKELTVYCRPAA